MLKPSFVAMLHLARIGLEGEKRKERREKSKERRENKTRPPIG
jgi:hypothetical protein